MQIDRVLYPIKTLGPGKRIGIWTVGCSHHCNKCSNPELWDPNINKDIPIDFLLEYIKKYHALADGVTITGGDPFFQPDDLYSLLLSLRKIGFNDILVYTGYEYERLLKTHRKVIDLIDVLIDGTYIDNLNDNQGIKGSSNQRVIVINKRLSTKYDRVYTSERKRQNFLYQGKIISVGIPNKSK